jgi:hypothetical protein
MLYNIDANVKIYFFICDNDWAIFVINTKFKNESDDLVIFKD